MSHARHIATTAFVVASALILAAVWVGPLAIWWQLVLTAVVPAIAGVVHLCERAETHDQAERAARAERWDINNTELDWVENPHLLLSEYVERLETRRDRKQARKEIVR